MQLSEAFKKAIRSYFNEEADSLTSNEGRKYVKSYFDSIEQEFGLSDIEAKDEKDLKKKDKK